MAAADNPRRLAPKQHFMRHAARWKTRLLLDPSRPMLGSWLMGHKDPQGKFVATCVACLRAAKAKGPGHVDEAPRWATTKSMAMSTFRRHAAKHHHQHNVSIMVPDNLRNGSTTTTWASFAPSVDAFLDVALATKRGHPLHLGLPRVGSKSKLRRMQYCIAEALRELDRQHLRTATCITVHADARGARYGMQYTACLQDLQHRRGFLGQTHLTKHKTGATGIADAAEEVVRKFCL